MNPNQRFFPAIILFVLIFVSVHAASAQRRDTRRATNVVLRTRQDRTYRTFLREAIGHPANFAGHYVLEGPGCGMECEMYAAIDKTTGRVIWLPFVIEDWVTMAEAANENRPIHFSLDSNRIVVLGHLMFDINHTETGRQTWQLIGGRFVRVRH